MTVMECKDETVGLSSVSAARTGKNREFEIGEQSGDFPQDVRKRCQDSKKSARRKKHSRSLEKQMRVEKEENFGENVFHSYCFLTKLSSSSVSWPFPQLPAPTNHKGYLSSLHSRPLSPQICRKRPHIPNCDK